MECRAKNKEQRIDRSGTETIRDGYDHSSQPLNDFHAADPVFSCFGRDRSVRRSTRERYSRLEAWAWRIIRMLLGSMAAMLLANIVATWIILSGYR